MSERIVVKSPLYGQTMLHHDASTFQQDSLYRYIHHNLTLETYISLRLSIKQIGS